MKKKQFLNEVERIATDLGWNVEIKKDNISFQQYTTQGQDFEVDIDFDDYEDIPELVKSYYECYNPVEEAKLWYGQNRGEPSDWDNLLGDMEECKHELRKLALSLEGIGEDNEEQTFEVQVKYVYEGKYFVKARNQIEAEAIVEEHCGARGNRPEDGGCNAIEDWDFDMCPEQIIVTE